MDRLLRLDLLEDTSQALRRNDSGPRRTWSTRTGNGVEYAGGNTRGAGSGLDG